MGGPSLPRRRQVLFLAGVGETAKLTWCLLAFLLESPLNMPGSLNIKSTALPTLQLEEQYFVGRSILSNTKELQ